MMERKRRVTGREPVTDTLDNVRCMCGKIVAQIEGNRVIIKCRHCKRYIEIFPDQADVELRVEFKEG